MLSTEQINDLHRLYWSERWSIRKIERHLHMGWRKIRKYLDAPAQEVSARRRISKLDIFKDTMAEWFQADPAVAATVIEQRLRPSGTPVVPASCARGSAVSGHDRIPNARSFGWSTLRAKRFEIDWAHFGVLDYGGERRKLYAFALV